MAIPKYRNCIDAELYEEYLILRTLVIINILLTKSLFFLKGEDHQARAVDNTTEVDTEPTDSSSQTAASEETDAILKPDEQKKND